MSGKPELLICVCAHRAITAPTSGSFDSLRFTDIPWVRQLLTGDALISRSRSCACTHFIEDPQQIPYMLFVDDDIQFTPEDVSKIYNHLRNGYDIIGGIYAVRGASQISSYGWGGHFDVDGKVQEIEYLATGFMGISRNILLRMKNELNLPILNANDWSRSYPFFECGRCFNIKGFEERMKSVFGDNQPDEATTDRMIKQFALRKRKTGDDIYISEDWDFCEKARQLGVKIYTDTSVQVGHWREQLFTPRDVRQVQGYTLLYKGSEHQKSLMQKIEEDLAEFLSQPIPEVQKRMLGAQKALAEMWDKKEGDVEDYYKNNQTYLYDLAMFNKTEEYFANRLGQLVNIHGCKVLDIGCGIGTAVFMMAEQNNQVTGWDINQECIDFCNFKKKKHNLSGDFTTEKPDYSQFDLVIAVDTLEHIKPLKRFLKVLGSEMKMGAKFYHSDYFPRDPVWPMHFEENGKFVQEWLQDAGLIPWDERWAIRGWPKIGGK